jgi:hypothetical protein
MTRRKAKAVGAVTRVGTHPYRPDGIPDVFGQDRCEDCGLDQTHRVHELATVDPAVAETTRRITGEREG